MGMGGKIEEDIDHIIDMGVDYIAIDGGQAAMKEAPPILAMTLESQHYTGLLELFII